METKQCNKCKRELPLSCFHKRIYKNGKIGSQPTCKECKKVVSNERYVKNKEHILAVSKQWSEKNKDRHNELRANFLKANGWYKAFGRANHRARKLNAIPAWADMEAIKTFYRLRPEGYVIDHIIPLAGKNVCGLHIVENLQYLTPHENSVKANKF